MSDLRVEELNQLMVNMTAGGKSSVDRGRILAFAYRLRLRRKLKSAPVKLRRALAGHKRAVKSLSRRILVAAKRGALSDKAKLSISPRVLLIGRRHSLLLDGLLPNRSKLWVSIPKRMRGRETTRLAIRNFSFLFHPEETIENLSRMAEAEATCISTIVDFEDEHCLDIGAWLVLSAMRAEMAPVFAGGAISNDLSKVISALRLDTALGMQVQPIWPDQQDIWAFPVQRRRRSGSSTSKNLHLEPQSKEKAGDELCDALNKWLSTVASQELSRSGRKVVKGMVGETLDNAERHANHLEHPDDSDWLLSGLMVRRNTPSGEKFDCQLAFLSVGSSISETIATCPDEMRRKMDRYVAAHTKTFTKRTNAFQHLQTIFALQPGVSRDPVAFLEGRGGTGFSDIISFFADLAGIESEEDKARLSVVSGRTVIHIGYPHCRSGGAKLGETPEMWLNGSNTCDDPPDKSCVVELERAFKGTLVTMAFTLDREYLERTANGND